MTDISGFRISEICKRSVAGFSLLLCVACAQTPDQVAPPQDHSTARKVHAFNKSLDSGIIRPVSVAYAQAVPVPVQDSVSNFADNLDHPRMVVNNLLQLDFEGAGVNSARFLVNSTFGLLGIFDMAAGAGVHAQDTDFGETLHVWGATEGRDLEMPLLGPTNERDLAGTVVDMFLNPLSYVLPAPEKYLGTGTKVLSKLGDRGRYVDTVDSILYDSADSFEQSRLYYEQNRRFELGQAAKEGALDPFSIDTEGF